MGVAGNASSFLTASNPLSGVFYGTSHARGGAEEAPRGKSCWKRRHRNRLDQPHRQCPGRWHVECAGPRGWKRPPAPATWSWSEHHRCRFGQRFCTQQLDAVSECFRRRGRGSSGASGQGGAATSRITRNSTTTLHDAHGNAYGGNGGNKTASSGVAGAGGNAIGEANLTSSAGGVRRQARLWRKRGLGWQRRSGRRWRHGHINCHRLHHWKWSLREPIRREPRRPRRIGEYCRRSRRSWRQCDGHCHRNGDWRQPGYRSKHGIRRQWRRVELHNVWSRNRRRRRHCQCDCDGPGRDEFRHLSSESSAYGGNGGTGGNSNNTSSGHGGNGGNATATSQGTNTQINSFNGTNVFASAVGGNGGLSSGVGFSPGLGGDASATATGTSPGPVIVIATATGGVSPSLLSDGSAVARASATGASGNATAQSFSSGGATVNVSTSAVAPVASTSVGESARRLPGLFQVPAWLMDWKRQRTLSACRTPAT